MRLTPPTKVAFQTACLFGAGGLLALTAGNLLLSNLFLVVSTIILIAAAVFKRT